MQDKLKIIKPFHPILSIKQQCNLINLNRSNYYYTPIISKSEDLNIANEIYDIWFKSPFYGYRKITEKLKKQGYEINHKKVHRLMNKLAIEAIYPKQKTSTSCLEHKKYPYLLRGLKINNINQVFVTDITYLKLKQGFMYLLAIMDLYSRLIVSWRLSNTLDVDFCLEALDDALNLAVPEIFNTDQGAQFTSAAWIKKLNESNIKISMDGKGSYRDNIHIERLWRTIKYEEIYLNDYKNIPEAEDNIKSYIKFYNYERPHQSLSYLTPAEVYYHNKNIF